MDEKWKNLKLSRALEDELRKAASRPSWESQNEGVHERVNFDDTIWGFNLAGGCFYNTPLRVTVVKEGSRAEKAGIRKGDILQSINDIDTATLTIQEAHDIIFESGIEIKLSLAAPDVEEPSHYIWQDEIEEDIDESRRRLESKVEEEKKPFNGAKTNEAWSLAWPCSKKRDISYRESNCFLVPSRYEIKQPEKIIAHITKTKLETSNENESNSSPNKNESNDSTNENKTIDFPKGNENNESLNENESSDLTNENERNGYPNEYNSNDSLNENVTNGSPNESKGNEYLNENNSNDSPNENVWIDNNDFLNDNKRNESSNENKCNDYPHENNSNDFPKENDSIDSRNKNKSNDSPTENKNNNSSNENESNDFLNKNERNVSPNENEYNDFQKKMKAMINLSKK